MNKISLLLSFALLILLTACSEDKPKPVKKTAPPKKEVAKAAPKEEVKEEPKEEEPEVIPIPPEELKKAEEIIAGVSEDDIAAVDAKAKYKMLCAACHGFTGDLNVNGAKDLSASTLSLKESVAQVYHGRGLMTPFKGILKDAEIVAVAQYIEKELRK